MTSSKLLIALRIPELGPSLGMLVVGTDRDPGGLSLAAIRYQLITKIIEHAGEARRLASNEERAAAIATLSRAVWLSAWDETVGAVAGLVLERIAGEILAEADRIAMPRQLREQVVPGAAERRALTARLGSAGAGLVPVLDELERRGAAALAATALERPALEAWHDALRLAARRLEAAWIALEDGVEAELLQWGPLVQRVARWRKPLWPVWVVSAVALAIAAGVGLMLGGFLPAPAALGPVFAR